MKETQTVPMTMLAKHVKAMKDAVGTTFQAISGADPAYLGAACADGSCTGTIGIIPFVGEFSWSLGVGLPKQTAIALAEKFAGFAIDYDSADMADVVGELANVLAGDVAARLDSAGCPTKLGLPAVIRGDGLQLKAPHSQVVLGLRFRLTQGEMWVSLASSDLAETPKGGPA